MTCSRQITLATVAAAALAAQSHGLAAQGVETLKARVGAPEAGAAQRPFGLPPNFEIYGYVKGDLRRASGLAAFLSPDHSRADGGSHFSPRALSTT